MPSVVSAVANAFMPNSEISDPALFAGRRAEVAHLAEALHAQGSCPLIIGHRGLGKTSLALQVGRIAMGDVTLLEDIGRPDLVVRPDTSFLTFFVRCTDATGTFEDLLERMLHTLTRASWDPETGRLVDRTTRVALSLKVLTAEVTESVSFPPLDSGTDREEIFADVVDEVLRTYGHRRLLVIVDELDRVRETRGLAAFIKAHSSEAVKFLPVGIAQDLSHLIHDHASLERLIVTVRLPSMSRADLEAIVTQGVRRMGEDGVQLSFSPAAQRRVADLASGFPWFVHVVGQTAALGAVREGRSTVEVEDIEATIAHLNENRFAQAFSDRYQRAVRDSYQRELVLRSFAQWDQVDIPTSEIYRVLRDDLEVANPSVYKGHLTQEEYGTVLMDAPFQQRGLVRFTDEMFKRYIDLRPSLYTNARERVEEAFGAN